MFKELGDLRHIRNFNRAILPISLAFFIYTFGWGVVSPVFSIYVNRITDNALLTGLILSITTMAGVFLNIPFGIIENRMNMKRILQTVLLFYSALALLYPEVNGFVPLLMLSVGRGIASSFLWLTSWAYVFTFTDTAVKGKETGFFSDMNDLASALSPIVGGIVSIASFFAPFYVLSLASLGAFVIVTLRLKESLHPERTTFESQVAKLAIHLRDRRFLRTIFMIVIFYAIINIYYSFISVFLNGEGMSVTLIGIILTIALLPAVSLEVPMGHMVDRHGIRKVLSIAVIATTVSGLMIPLSSNFYFATVTITAFTISYTAIFIGLYSRMSDVMSEDKVAMTGAIATFKDLGYTVGPLVAGLLIGYVGMVGTFLIAGGAFILLLPLTLTLHD